jgi:hypothetical protein
MKISQKMVRSLVEFFYDCVTESYNSKTDEMYTEMIPAGTILVDKKTAFLSVLGAINNTIIHECVHWPKLCENWLQGL